jgi:hypothetical protein
MFSPERNRYCSFEPIWPIAVSTRPSEPPGEAGDQDLLGGLGGEVDRGRLDVGGGLGLGLGDLALGHFGAARDLLFELGLGFRRDQRGVGLGGFEHAGGLTLGFFPLGLHVGEQGLGLFPQLLGLVEFGLDLGRVGVERPNRAPGRTLSTTSRPMNRARADQDPQLGIGEIEEGFVFHRRLS